jgi:hypothetical protein
LGHPVFLAAAMTSSRAEPAVAVAGKLAPSSRTLSMASSASGNSSMTLGTAMSCATPGYVGFAPAPMNCARISAMNSLTNNPSEVASDGAAWGTGVSCDFVFSSMDVLSPFMVFWLYRRGSWLALVCLQTQQMRTDASHQRRSPLKEFV